MEEIKTEFADEVMRAGANEFYKLLLLQRRFNFLEALESFLVKDKISSGASAHYVEARLVTYFLEAGIFLKKTLKDRKKEFEELETEVYKAHDLKAYCKVSNLIDQYLYEFNILSVQSDYIGHFSPNIFKKRGPSTEEIFEPD